MVLSKLIKEYKEMCLEDVPVEEVLEDLQKLEDIYKPKDVPQFVVDWFEKYKDNLEYNIWDWMKYNLEPKKRENVIFSRWLGKTVNNPVETLIKMKLYGYEVEKEKRYLVKMKSLGTNFSFLNLNKTHNHWMFSSKNECDIYQVRHTRKELEKAGFGEVFNSPLFEVEEVE